MTKEIDWSDVRETYMERLAAPDVRGGALVVEKLVEKGVAIPDVVHELLHPAQVEVGRRWQANEWSVADEHAASAVTEAALMAASSSAPAPAKLKPETVVLACAYGEWHTLPLRMVAEVFSASGFNAVFLGPSVPPDHLRSFLANTRPLALALHCSHPLSLEGARESIDAAHATGVPVLVGGRGFGVDGHRAVMVGADAWSDDPVAGVAILDAWAAAPPTSLATAGSMHGAPMPDETELMAVRKSVDAALAVKFPAMVDYTEAQWKRTHEDIDYIASYAVTSVRFDDDTVITDFALWLRDLLSARRVPSTVFDASLLAISDALQSQRPEAAAHLVRVAQHQI